jgi:HEPN domain-containing protein
VNAPAATQQFLHGLMERSGESVRGARDAVDRGDLALAARLCQEGVELALKSALRGVGYDPPRQHDVGPFLHGVRDRFPPWFRDRIDQFASLSYTLVGLREKSVYGDEMTGQAPRDLISDPREVKQLLKRAEEVLSSCSDLIRKRSSTASSRKQNKR